LDRVLHEFSAFDAQRPQRLTRLGDEEIAVTRFSHASYEAVEMSAPVEDSFAMVHQLRHLPAHIISNGGHRIPVARGPAHTMALLDLAVGPRAVIAYPFDSVHVRIPRTALHVFADRNGQRRVDELRQSSAPFADIDPVVGGLCGLLVENLHARSPSALLGDHLLLSLVAHLSERYGTGGGSPRARSGGLAPWQERRAKAMLDDPGAAHNLAEVAEACGVSLAHFSRAFRSTVGVSPWAWHQERRLSRAEALMRDHSLTLTHIAAATGFTDQSHLTRTFTAKRGMSPHRWRLEQNCR
jgi:AraC family transcriptional regulator